MVHSVNDRVVFTPAGQDDRPEDERVTFSLQVPGRLDLIKLRRAIVAEGGNYWEPHAIRAALRRGVERLLPGEEDADKRSEILGTLERFYELNEAVEEVDPERQKAWAENSDEDPELETLIEEFQAAYLEACDIQAMVARGDQALRDMLADNVVYPDIRRDVTLRMFVLDWSGLKRKCERGEAGLTDAALGAIPEEHLDPVYLEIDRIARVQKEQAKN